MKWIVAWVLAGSTVAAAAPDVLPFKPSPAKRKIASEKYTVESLAKFVDAIIADKAGDVSEAESKYRDIREKYASTIYNLADVKRRLEHYPQAVTFYKEYLDLAPDAPDRREVERLIELIQNRPPVAVIDGEDMDAVVLVDGKLIGPSPAIMKPTKGPHVADRIGPRTYRHQRFSTASSETKHLQMKYEEAEGNVILSSSPLLVGLAGAWEEDGVKYLLPGRFTLAPGHYETYVKSDTHACNKIAFDVGKGDDLTYVYVDLKAGTSPGRCKDLTANQQKIRLPR